MRIFPHIHSIKFNVSYSIPRNISIQWSGRYRTETTRKLHDILMINKAVYHKSYLITLLDEVSQFLRLYMNVYNFVCIVSIISLVFYLDIYLPIDRVSKWTFAPQFHAVNRKAQDSHTPFNHTASYLGIFLLHPNTQNLLSQDGVQLPI